MKAFLADSILCTISLCQKDHDTLVEATHNQSYSHTVIWLTVWENTAMNALHNWQCVYLYYMTEEGVNSCQHNSIVKRRQLQLPKRSRHMIQVQWHEGWEAWRSALWSYNGLLLATIQTSQDSCYSISLLKSSLDLTLWSELLISNTLFSGILDWHWTVKYMATKIYLHTYMHACMYTHTQIWIIRLCGFSYLHLPLSFFLLFLS